MSRAQDKNVVDHNGFTTSLDNPIIGCGVFGYTGAELGIEGLDPHKVYGVYRPAEELCKQGTIDSFKLTPFINGHKWLGKQGVDAGTQSFSGVVGEVLRWEHPFIRGTLKWFSEEMRQELDSGKRELSPAYAYDLVAEAGTYEGKDYQYKQTNIRGNHQALVDAGRHGYELRVLDHKQEVTTVTIDELIEAVLALTPEDLAKLRDVLPKAEDEEVKGEEEPKAEDEEEGEPKDKETEGLVEELKEEIKELKAAVEAKAADSATLFKMFAQRDALGKRVQELVGHFACDSMTALEIATYGLDKLGVTRKDKTNDLVLMEGYLSAVQSKPKSALVFAQDSKKPAASALDILIKDL